MATSPAATATPGARASFSVGSLAVGVGFAVAAVLLPNPILVTPLTAQLRQREARSKNLALQSELERSRLEKLALDARLDLLQAKIEPHFLFNTLAHVQALVESNSPCASATVQSLMACLRAAMLRLQEREPTLGDELTLVRWPRSPVGPMKPPMPTCATAASSCP